MKKKVFITIILGTIVTLFLFITKQNYIPNEIAKMQKNLPVKINDSMMLTEIYQDGKTVFYVISVDTEMSKEDLQLSQNSIEKEKQAIITDVRRGFGSELFQFKQLIDGLVYLYRNNNGKELYRITISKYEL